MRAGATSPGTRVHAGVCTRRIRARGTHRSAAAVHPTPAAGAQTAFFRYCLGLRGGGSSHFAPICTAKLRRDQSSGGGGWDKCTECHINHTGIRDSLSFSFSFSLSLCVSLCLCLTLSHTLFPPVSNTSHIAWCQQVSRCT